MKQWVADASVIVKWMMPERESEQNASEALELLFAYKHEQIRLVQPMHWLAEVAAVLARVSQPTAQAKIEALLDFEIPLADTPAIWQTACELAVSLNHHLFDTLYHAVALCTTETRLVTADRRYYEKAASKGAIVLLNDFRL